MSCSISPNDRPGLARASPRYGPWWPWRSRSGASRASGPSGCAAMVGAETAPHYPPPMPFSAPAVSPSLGVTVDAGGATFALYSAHATAVELCLFAAAGDAVETRRVPLARGRTNIWHAAVDGVAPGQLYGYRVHGPWAPQQGHYFNPAKLLLDPYARALSGPVAWH